jgi:tetratricopeptide (TPR) repeat protein
VKILRFVAITAILVAASGCRSSRDYIAEADRFFAAKKYAEAALVYRKALQKDPRSDEAYYKLGLTQRAAGNYAAAFESFSRALLLNPSFDQANVELGNLYLGDYLIETVKNPKVHQKIATIADRLLAKNPKSFAGFRLRGYLALSDKKPNEAISFFQQARQIDPTQPDVVLGLTQSLLLAGRYPEARQTASDLIEKNKTFGSVYDVLYAYEMSAGHSADAEALLKLKITNNPQSRDSVLQLAEHYWHAGKPAQSFQLLDAVLREDQTPWRCYLAAVNFYKEIREWDRALEAVSLGLKAHPEENVSASGAQAATLALEGKPKQAVGVLDDALRQNPASSELRKSLALLLLDSPDKGDHARALSELITVSKASPNDLDTAYALGRAYSLQGETDRAAQQFESVIRKDPKNVPALLALAEFASTSKKFAQTLQYSERVLAVNPASHNARLLHAAALVGLGQLDLARSEYNHLLRDQPAYTEAKLQLAMLDVVQKRFPDAEKLFRETYQPKKGDFRALKGLVELYAAEGQIEKALSLLNADLARYPDSIAVRSLLASTAARAGKLDLAIQQYEQLREKHGEDPETYTQLGQLYQRKHDLARSIAMLQRAAELAPGDWKAATRLGVVQQVSGLASQAKGNYGRAIELGGDDPDLFNNLAYLDADMGADLDEAMALSQKGLAKSPNNSQYTDTAGFIYFKKGDTGTALQIFQALSHKYPNDAGFRYHLALALLKSGNRAQGEHELRTAVAADPSLADATRVKNLLGPN